MGIYARNISNLSMKELDKNIRHIEEVIAEKKVQIQRIERRMTNPVFAEKYGNARLAILENSLCILENKLDINNHVLDEICDRTCEEIQQLKRDGKWDCDEQPNEEEG